MTSPLTCDVVVVGAGMVGAACAYYAARAGLDVTLVDRGPVAGGTTGAGEGNLLVSDKEPGPELELALLSGRLWAELVERRPGFGHAVEYEAKGGLVVAETPEALTALTDLAARQSAAGVEVSPAAADQLRELEPHLAPGLAGAVRYPQDAQVMPALAAAHLVRASGARPATGASVTAVLRTPDGSVRGVRTDRGDIHAPAVVNAAGTWGGEVARLAGVRLPVLPRRGFVLVTEPLPRMIWHKVYAADYVADVASDSAALATSPVVEGTAAGPVLIGASRERVGFDRTFSLPVVRELAAGATRLFPFLVGVHAVRAYVGFRPYLPDHLPAIGPDARVPGLFHACGHEGAGIGLATGTGYLIAQVLAGRDPDLDLTPFRPERFSGHFPDRSQDGLPGALPDRPAHRGADRREDQETP
ncbi:FAD-dependent oxidoreductase [Streptomyces avermitilis]|uniref:Oxidoreductase n=2 Tax=Streptomyces avermitilis TaxID=33903 RepID=Q82MC6_STRAW|nr:FAD-binding oxidoreductase [Streptomyces avermitilis]MYS97359.1 FAD-dependent oxidoreductase [Streptomyces sp. SID5469]KUN55497.1 FAD-dependent oxidoreductase [Streptomyces avermitilis]BAC69445.1 putative oxidoreductase [Streptomyces avermitilis MA-4680 = NBRC 14893]BBJ49441.1 oxidoreductase [Streptomyces avermitilis]GDY61464.1 oxidoreductase [Streptomyces avermitilis]